MRKHRSSKKPMRKAAEPQWAMGLDLGDRSSRYAIVDRDGELSEEDEYKNTAAGLAKVFADIPRPRIAREAGGHRAQSSVS